MKKLITLAIVLLFVQLATAQEFSFQMFFEDAAGNKDTLTIGYDPNGTDTIDAQLGEVNIISTPLDSAFDVRITNEWFNREAYGMPGTFHTKNQIVKKQPCGFITSINSIDILTDNWPVAVHWDSTVFNDSCLNGSLFTSVNPGGWWDTPGFVAVLAGQSHIVFIPNEDSFSNSYNYINDSNDTLDVFWQTFGDSTLLIPSVGELNLKNQVDLFPNPAGRILNYTLNRQGAEIEYVRLFDIAGKPVQVSMQENSIDLTGVRDGIYFIQFHMSGLPAITRTIIKRQ